MVTLAGSLVHFFDVLVGEMPGQDAIMGMDFMVPVETRSDLADGTPCLPNEVHIQLTKRRPLHGEHLRSVETERMISVDATQPLEVPIRRKPSETLWITRGERWIPTVVKGPGKRLYLRITNDEVEDQIEGSSELLVDRSQYDPPKGILKRPGSQPAVVNQITKLPNPEEAEITDDEPAEAQIALADESGDLNPEATGRASERAARAMKTVEVEKAEEPAAAGRPVYGDREHSEVNRERHLLIETSQTNKSTSAKVRTLHRRRGAPDGGPA
ncbi:hypothetical protein PI124_g6043 [Phytophthora idaei]|nr:hypothetical protein PI124_g6043 [Phytophthora idaei]